MSVSGHPEEPMKVGVSMIDILTGLYASTAVLAALRHRDLTGEGQFIDLSLLDCGLASLSHFAMNYLVSGEVPQRRGNGGYGGIPSQAFPCKDKPIFLVAGNDKQFAAFCAAADRTDLLQDERFATTSARIAHREEILPVLAAILRTRTRDEWLTVLDAHDVPAGPYNEMPEVFADPQIQHRGMLIEVDDPASGQLPMLANPIRFTATPVEGYAPPPALGEHTAEVLTALAGVTESRLAALRDRGVV
jgi:crotonobetainyl-CoA:carnitine CoA-transferase CaiB-like acyl-CoA transferase